MRLFRTWSSSTSENIENTKTKRTAESREYCCTNIPRYHNHRHQREDHRDITWYYPGMSLMSNYMMMMWFEPGRLYLCISLTGNDVVRGFSYDIHLVPGMIYIGSRAGACFGTGTRYIQRQQSSPRLSTARRVGVCANKN